MGTSRPILSLTWPVRATVSFRRWCRPTKQPAGRNVRTVLIDLVSSFRSRFSAWTGTTTGLCERDAESLLRSGNSFFALPAVTQVRPSICSSRKMARSCGEWSAYRRFESLEAAALLARLDRRVWLFVNFFSASFKLIGSGALAHGYATLIPRRRLRHQRVMAEVRTAVAVRIRVQEFIFGSIRSCCCATSGPPINRSQRSPM